jgi:tetratricopeptide (TPR) repeat protein
VQAYRDAASGGDAAAILWLGLLALTQKEVDTGVQLLRQVAVTGDLEPAWRAGLALRELYGLPPAAGSVERILSAATLDEAMALATGVGRDSLAAFEAEARRWLSGPCPHAAYPVLLLGSRLARAAGAPDLAAQLLLTLSDAAMAMDLQDYGVHCAAAAATDARGALDAGLPQALGSLVRADISASEWEVEKGEVRSALARLGDLRLRAFRLGSPVGETWASAGLAYVHVVSGNVDAAEPYAMLASDALLEGRAVPDALVDDAPDRERLAPLMLRCSDLERSRGALERALEYARRATALRPDHGAGPLAEGQILKDLGRPEEAIAAFDAGLLHDPPSRVHWLSHRVDCLVTLERFDEALTAMDEIVTAVPDQAEAYINRAQVRRARDEWAEAIADYRRGLALGGGNDDLRARALARGAIVECLLALGDLDTARSELRSLLEDADAGERLTGRLLLARLHWQEGRTADWLADLDAALAEAPGQPNCLISRADGLIQLGRHREALPDLAELAETLPEPEHVIPHLDAVLAALPEDAGALKWRGRARLRAQRPSLAVEDLSRALASRPDDWQALLWRGLACISRSKLPEERQFNETLTRERVLGGLEDLAAAAAHAPEPERPLAAYRWVVDRVSADTTMRDGLLERGEQPNGLFTTVPGVREALRHWAESVLAAAAGGWEAAVAGLHEAQAGPEGAGRHGMDPTAGPDPPGVGRAPRQHLGGHAAA